jgi:major membrane immunogen (membrane-anchored lipoprotein)
MLPPSRCGLLCAARYLKVMYQHSGAGSTQVLRQVLHRPLDNSSGSSVNSGGSNVLISSSYDSTSGELIMRAKQRCTFTRASVKVSSRHG